MLYYCLRDFYLRNVINYKGSDIFDIACGLDLSGNNICIIVDYNLLTTTSGILYLLCIETAIIHSAMQVYLEEQ